ncbi:MAG: DUF2318 domain-containing protein [Geobacter sp.]|nr:MAG: DUF2318 domain-containing protein [Geobacter sp.]
MFESFVIMLREGIEGALVLGIIVTLIKRDGRSDLMRPVWTGFSLAVIASVAVAFLMKRELMPVSEEVYEGTLYWTSALFVITMMWWLHRKSKSLKADIENRVVRAMDGKAGLKEPLAFGAFVFLMIFREGAEAVMFLSAVNLTTDAILSFAGSVLGLAVAMVFYLMFVRGSLKVNLKRFFTVTEWMLGIFVLQLVINGYHELSEIAVVPATQATMAFIGPIVRNNTLFILALVALPLFIWLTKEKVEIAQGELSESARRLFEATAKKEKMNRLGAVAVSFLVLVAVGAAYAKESMPKELPMPEMIMAKDGLVSVPLGAVADGKLHRYGLASGDKVIRFIVVKTSDGKCRTGFDACEICGAFGYTHEGKNLTCLNCAAEIDPFTVGSAGGCNPIPLKAEQAGGNLVIAVADLKKEDKRFAESKIKLVAVDPVCGMRVSLSEAGGFESYKGKTYYFCNMGDECRKRFVADPSKYTK